MPDEASAADALALFALFNLLGCLQNQAEIDTHLSHGVKLRIDCCYDHYCCYSCLFV